MYDTLLTLISAFRGLYIFDIFSKKTKKIVTVWCYFKKHYLRNFLRKYTVTCQLCHESKLSEPIIPYDRQSECMNAAGNALQCWNCVERFPAENRNMFIYFASFISELVERNANALG